MHDDAAASRFVQCLPLKCCCIRVVRTVGGFVFALGVWCICYIPWYVISPHDSGTIATADPMLLLACWLALCAFSFFFASLSSLYSCTTAVVESVLLGSILLNVCNTVWFSFCFHFVLTSTFSLFTWYILGI